MTADLHGIRYVTGHYKHLQGLKLVIYGAAIVAYSALLPFYRDMSARTPVLIMLVLLALVVWGYRTADAFYKRHFGAVEPEPRNVYVHHYAFGGSLVLVALAVVTIGFLTESNAQTGVALFCLSPIAPALWLVFKREVREGRYTLEMKWEPLVSFIAVCLFLVAFWLDDFSYVPLSFMGLWLTVGLLLLWRMAPDFRRPYLAAALFCLVVSFAPTLGLLSERLLTATMFGLYGTLYVVLGLFDHFLLARTLKPTFEA